MVEICGGTQRTGGTILLVPSSDPGIVPWWKVDDANGTYTCRALITRRPRTRRNRIFRVEIRKYLWAQLPKRFGEDCLMSYTHLSFIAMIPETNCPF
jgi:hypothetical protein